MNLIPECKKRKLQLLHPFRSAAKTVSAPRMTRLSIYATEARKWCQARRSLAPVLFISTRTECVGASDNAGTSAVGAVICVWGCSSSGARAIHAISILAPAKRAARVASFVCFGGVEQSVFVFLLVAAVFGALVERVGGVAAVGGFDFGGPGGVFGVVVGRIA